MNLILEDNSCTPKAELCNAYGVAESTYYDWKARKNSPVDENDRKSSRHWKRLQEYEEQEVLNVLTSERFIDICPGQIFATLLDEGKYLCSTRTMYRILEMNASAKERRDQRKHPEYVKPELLAEAPNQVWSWDIAKLRTGRKHEYHYLYVIIDIFSRAVVGWLVAEKESAELAERFIAETIYSQGINPDQLTLHADRGSAMKSKAVSQLLADLRVERTHSRPHVSNDNPYSEAQFKTLKYHSTYPKNFPTLEEAKLFLKGWFQWYNNEHRHSGINMLTPNDVHTGKAKDIIRKRQTVLDEAYRKAPHRFAKGRPIHPEQHKAVWINKPLEKAS